jgi:hypothetical protein
MKSPRSVHGYVVSFSIKKVFDQETTRLDVEIILSDESGPSSSLVTLVGSDVRDVRYGDAHQGIDFGAWVFLSIADVSDAGMEGIRFKVANVEQGCPLSFYARSVEVFGRQDVNKDGKAP